MSSSLSGLNPLSYLGVESNNPPKLIFQTRAPLTSDIENFEIGTVWIDKDEDNVYMLTNKLSGVATWTFLGGATTALETITMPDLTVINPVNENINFLNGSGISVTGSSNNITFTATAIPFTIQWNVTTAATENLSVNEGYFANNGGGVTYTLPATAALGDVIFVSSINAGGWTIAQNAGQAVRMGNQITTTGAGGSLASSDIGDSVQLVCAVANTTFVIVNSMGNITVT